MEIYLNLPLLSVFMLVLVFLLPLFLQTYTFSSSVSFGHHLIACSPAFPSLFGLLISYFIDLIKHTYILFL